MIIAENEQLVGFESENDLETAINQKQPASQQLHINPVKISHRRA